MSDPNSPKSDLEIGQALDNVPEMMGFAPVHAINLRSKTVVYRNSSLPCDRTHWFTKRDKIGSVRTESTPYVLLYETVAFYDFRTANIPRARLCFAWTKTSRP